MVQSLDEARRRSKAAGARIPPHDLPAEESLLGAMLLSKDAIAAAVEQCKADDFYKPAHGHVFDAICSLYSLGEPVDPVTVADELRRAGLLDAIGGPATLISLQAATPATSSAGRYARIVADHAVLRRLIGVANEIAEIGYEVPDDVAAALDRAETMVFNVAERNSSDTLLPLRELLGSSLDRLEALYDKGESVTGVPTGYVDLDEQLSGLQKSSLVIVGARPAMGKAQPVGTPVLTPDGWRAIGELAVGDHVVGSDGRPTRVLGVFPQGRRPVYRVALDDGTSTRACGEHLWWVLDQPDGAAKPGRILTTDGIRQGLGRGGEFHLPVVGPVELPPVDLPVDPYALGCAIGLCCTSAPGPAQAAALTRHGAPPAGAGVSYAGTGAPLSPPGACTGATRFPPAGVGVPSPDAGLNQAGVGVPCTDAGLPPAGTGTPSPGAGRRSTDVGVPPTDVGIPPAYLRSGAGQRLDLLQGLMDTRGRHRRGWNRFGPCLPALAADVADLVRGLGGVATVRAARRSGPGAPTQMAVVWFRLPEAMTPCRADLRRAEWTAATSPAGRWPAPAHRVVSVESDGEEECVCIWVSNDDHLYVTEQYIVTHNTSFALGMAAHAAMEAGHPALVFSLEMSHLEITQRLLCAEARVDATRMRNGKLVDSDWSKISHAIGRLGEAPIFIDDNPNVTIMDIRAKARRLKSREGLGLIVIDYLQLMTGRTSAESRQVEVSEISRGLKILARELEVPVVALSQLSRTLESRSDKRPMLADLRESGCLTAESRIWRADLGREVAMGDLYASGERNIPVWSVDDDLRLVPGVMSHVWCSGVKPVYQLTLGSGRSIRASANHPFLTVEGWRRLDELVPGHRLAIRRTSDAGGRRRHLLTDVSPPGGAGALVPAGGLPAPAAHSTAAVANRAAGPATHVVGWDEVVSIRLAGEKVTFDGTVAGTHNFVANGIVVHNSLEQDADVVMFIYRDDVYNPESPDRGTAEVIVAKHRNGPTGIARLAFLDHYARFANMARV